MTHAVKDHPAPGSRHGQEGRGESAAHQQRRSGLTDDSNFIHLRYRMRC
jgi:hypothetical protein